MKPGNRTLSDASLNKAVLLGAATLMLLLGIAVYVLDRESASVYFLTPFGSLDPGTSTFGSLGGQLPEFVHVYAFSLLTAIIFNLSRRIVLLSCGFWWLIDTMFEVGQHPIISPHIVSFIPSWFSRVPFLENTTSYFLYGTYDPWDLLAILLGGLTAYGTAVRLHRE